MTSDDRLLLIDPLTGRISVVITSRSSITISFYREENTIAITQQSECCCPQHVHWKLCSPSDLRLSNILPVQRPDRERSPELLCLWAAKWAAGVQIKVAALII